MTTGRSARATGSRTSVSSSARGTARASTSAAGRPLTLPAYQPVATYPVRVDGTGYVATGRYAGRVSGPPRADVEARAVPRADDDALVRVPVALAERPVVVRAAVLDRDELAAAVVDADVEQPAR